MQALAALFYFQDQFSRSFLTRAKNINKKESFGNYQ